MAWQAIGIVRRNMGDLDGAREALDRALVAAAEAGEPESEARIDLGTLALALVVSRASGRAGRRGKGPSTSDAVVVAAAGNEGTTQAMFPAALKGVVAVAALDAGGSPTPWTNRGPWVDCAALGDGVVGPHVRGMGAPHGGAPAQAFDGWARWSGTSFAAPHVAGRIAAALAAGAGSARVAAATVLALGQPLPVASGLGVRVR